MPVSAEGRVENQNEPKRPPPCGRLGSFWFSTRFTRKNVFRLAWKTVYTAVIHFCFIISDFACNLISGKGKYRESNQVFFTRRVIHACLFLKIFFVKQKLFNDVSTKKIYAMFQESHPRLPLVQIWVWDTWLLSRYSPLPFFFPRLKFRGHSPTKNRKKFVFFPEGGKKKNTCFFFHFLGKKKKLFLNLSEWVTPKLIMGNIKIPYLCFNTPKKGFFLFLNKNLHPKTR